MGTRITVTLIFLCATIGAFCAPENLCKNPGFELLEPAGDNFPLNWQKGTSGEPGAVVRIDSDTHSGAVAVRMTAPKGSQASLSSDTIQVKRGTLRFNRKVVSSGPADPAFQVAVAGVSTGETEVSRREFSIPKENAAPGEWREERFDFDFFDQGAVAGIQIRVTVPGNETGTAEWLVDDFSVEQRSEGPLLAVEALYMPDPVLQAGKPSELILQIANRGDSPVEESQLLLEMPVELALQGSQAAAFPVPSLPPGEFRRYTWTLTGSKAGEYDISAVWKTDSRGGTAGADCQQPGNGAIAFANDGNKTTYWYAGEERHDGKLWIRFHENQPVQEIRILGWAEPRHAPKDYALGVFLPGGGRKEAARITGETRKGEWLVFPCEVEEATGVWLDISSTIEGKYGPVIYELQAFGGRKGEPIRLVSQAGGGRASKSRHVVCVDQKDPRALCRRPDGYWRMMPKPEPLQKGNTHPLAALKALRSADLPDSCIGITAHLPREKDFEAIFEPVHLIDGDPQTSWSGRAHATSVPGCVDQVQIDLAGPVDLATIRLWPYWKAEGFPIDFTVSVHVGGQWEQIHRATGVHLEPTAGEGSKRPYEIALKTPVRADALRVEVTRFSPAHPFFTDCAVTNYFRLSGIEAMDTSGANAALAEKGAHVDTQWTYRSYYNSPEVVNKTYPEMYELGAKWNRVGQWGDWTCWVAVERTKGVYTIVPDLDQAVTDSVRNGLNILLTLDYGNPLYEETPWLTDPGPVWRHGHPFTGDGGPTTPEAIQGFVDYARFMAKHFKGRVHNFEIWNEENSWAWYGSPPSPKAFGTLLRETAKAVKEVDPENRIIVGGTAALAPSFISEALEEGGGKYLDGFAFHPYTMPYPEMGLGTLDVVDGKQVSKSKEDLGYQTYEEMLAFLRKTFDRFNPNFEIWADEWNAVPTSEDSPYQGCSEIVEAKQAARFFLVNTLHNIKAVWWSLANQNTVYDWGILRTEDLSRKPIFYTIQALTTLLSGAKAAPDIAVKTHGDHPGLRCEPLLSRDGGTLVALWAASSPIDDYPMTHTDVSVACGSTASVTAVDTFHALTQELSFDTVEGGIRIHDVLVADYPVILKIESGAGKAK